MEQFQQRIQVGFEHIDKKQEHVAKLLAEQHRRQIPRVLLLIPDQHSGTNVIESVKFWMQSKVADQLRLVMQCEMRVAKNKLSEPYAHGVLWHLPKAANDRPYGYKFSQPKEPMRKLQSVLRHVTNVMKVRIRCPTLSMLSLPSSSPQCRF